MDKKIGTSFFGSLEKKLIVFLLPLVPKKIETYHLTLTTILWNVIIIFSGYMAKFNIIWLFGMSIGIILQYLTDLLDGQVGRKRHTGLIRWGFYMDHMLDYLFLCSILIGYSFITPYEQKWILFFTLVIFGGYMIHSFLNFGITRKFKIYYLGIGPTEVRFMFLCINLMILLFGKIYFVASLPYMFFFSFVGLIVVIYRTQKNFWKLDMEKKHKK